jgi:hypothetical protein
MPERLHQINLHFDPVEDRILLRMTVGAPEALSEFRILLTRRFVALLWKSLQGAAAESVRADERIAPASRDAVLRFQQESALARADFSTPFSQGDVATPLGDAPILVSRARVARSPQGGRILSLQAADGPALQINMNDQLLHSFMKLLSDAAGKAQWGLDLRLMSEREGTPDQPVPARLS